MYNKLITTCTSSTSTFDTPKVRISFPYAFRNSANADSFADAFQTAEGLISLFPPFSNKLTIGKPVF